MAQDCKIKTYKKVIMPNGALDGQESILNKHLLLNGGYNLLCGDLMYLFYDSAEEEDTYTYK